MSRITISDLAIDSNSFINEVAETEAAFVNGGSFAAAFNAGFGPFALGIFALLADVYKKGLGIFAILDIVLAK